jgi:SAM-dependent methyltransferase
VIDRALAKLRSEGLLGVARAVRRRILPRPAKPAEASLIAHRESVALPSIGALSCFQACKGTFHGKKGLEIGGPSGVFARDGIFPVYPLAGRLDNCNFSKNTIWEGQLEAGLNFHYDPEQPPGWQYLSEAVDLREIPTGTYDFILSSHMLEHTANPLRALREWMRVIREGGTLVIIVPRPEGTFDHRRPVTPLAHLVEDFERGTKEDDLTHLPEILKLHDLTRDPWAGDLTAFTARSQRNFENRCLHHHVFNSRIVEGMLDYVGLQIHAVEESLPIHIFGIAEKLKAGQVPHNAAVAPHLRDSTVRPLRARAQAS